MKKSQMTLEQWEAKLAHDRARRKLQKEQKVEKNMNERAKIKVADIRPNPYRDEKHLPIDRVKVEALKASIKTTGFWDNLVVRQNGNIYELAYGHHRLVALKELNIEEIDIPVRNLSNERMLQMMANENMEEWANNQDVHNEAIRSIIQAFGRGDIEFPPVKEVNNANVRFAPSFLIKSGASGRDEKKAYTRRTLCEFLGWDVVRQVDVALDSLRLIEETGVREDVFAGLTMVDSIELAEQGKKVLKAAGKDLAEQFVVSMSTVLKNPEDRRKLTVKDIRIAADRIIGKPPKPKKKPDINKFAERLILDIHNFLESKEEKMQAIMDNKDGLTEDMYKSLGIALMDLSEKLGNYSNQLKMEAIEGKTNSQAKLAPPEQRQIA